MITKEISMYSLPQEDLTFIVQQLKDLWPRKKRFLITGGTGFFGRWLVESCALLEERGMYGNEYIVVTRQSPEVIIEKLSCLRRPEFHVLQHELNMPFNEKFNVDYVIHAATDVKTIKAGENSAAHIADGTVNVIEAVRKADPRFLYVSSGAVYTDQNGPDEASAVITAGAVSYGAAKRMSEVYVEQSIQNFCIVRCFAFLGPFADPQMAVMQMLHQKVNGRPVEVGSPAIIRSFMYARDMARAILALLVGTQLHRLYNLGSDVAVTLGSVACKISELETPANVRVRGAAEGVSLAGNCYIPAIDRLRAEIPDLVSVSLDDALSKTYNFLKRGRSA